MSHDNEDLIKYEDDAPTVANGPRATAPAGADDEEKKRKEIIDSTGFRDFQLNPELLRAIGDLGFEHFLEECIPQAVLGVDVSSSRPNQVAAISTTGLAEVAGLEAKHERGSPGHDS